MMSCYKLICLVLLLSGRLIAVAGEAYIVIPINNGDDTLSLIGRGGPVDPNFKDRKMDFAPTRTTPRTNNKDDPINLDPAIFKQYYGYDKPTGPVDTWPVDIRRRLGLN
jgi:hypothetical protein